MFKVFPHRIIDDGLYGEKEDLHVKTYFDARWPDPGNKEVSGAAIYDRAIHHAAWLLEKTSRIKR